jgi:MFS family permease
MEEPFMRLSSTRLFTISRFWLLWLATVFANLADGVFKLALPLLAMQIEPSPSVVAGVAFVVRLPWLLFALFAGVLVDRLDRRQTMIVANMVRVFALLSLVAAIVLNMLSLPLLYALALLLGIAETFADTSSAAILPSVLEGQKSEKANAWLIGGITVSNEFIGPPLGGALILLSLAFAFGGSSLLYLLATIALLFMTGSFKPSSEKAKPILSDLSAGLRYVWENALLRNLVFIVTVMNLAWSAWAAVMVLYLVGEAGVSEFAYGLMLTSIGIGGLVGAVITVPIVERWGRAWAIAADILGTVLMLLVPALTTNIWLIGVAAVIGGIGSSMWGIVVSSIRQETVPDEMQGRSSGVFRLFGYGALPLGAAFAGFVAEWINIPTVFAICAILNILLFIPFWQVRGLLKKRSNE